ncbi:hypothetical protein C0993_010442 [Termitomyces sp. T159_Od127]|nr:hypothetical protein C0993_010442 [Termitomyces sp. T159_Od127]
MGLYLQTQLNATDMQEALDPNQADPNSLTDSHNTLDYTNNKEALCLCFTSPCINWQNLTLHFDHQAVEYLEPILFNVTTSISIADHPHTPLQLHSKSTQLFVLNAQLGKSPQVLTALVDSGATGTFVSDQLNLIHDLLNRSMELQLFDGKPTTAGPITKTHTHNNGLQFLVHLLVTQLSEVTPIVLGLLWLCNVNPNIN